jgi:hypothetical protein
MARALALLLVGAMLSVHGAFSQETKPRVPPGRDPGGVAVALLTTGIDYTLPPIAARLARDGEGEPIALDVPDADNRPFPKDGDRRADASDDGTALAGALTQLGPRLRLIPVRIDLHDPVSLAKAAAFIAQTPARLVVVPFASASKADWEPFRQAAERLAQLLFVVGAGDEGKDLDADPLYPASLGLANVLVVTTAGAAPGYEIAERANFGARVVDAVAPAASLEVLGTGGRPQRLSGSVLATLVAIHAAAALLAREPALRGAELKRRLLAISAHRSGETARKTRTPAVLSE